MVNRLSTLLTALIMTLCGAAASAANFTAAVDRTTAAIGEPIQFKLELTNSDTRLRAEGVDPNIDLSVLARDFDLGRPEAANRYNIYRGQGRSTSSITVSLFAKHAGLLRIPAFTIDGLSTAPLEIEARAMDAQQADEIFTRITLNADSVWQQQALIVHLDLYQRVEILSASIGTAFDSEPVPYELLEHRTLPKSERQEMHNGVPYTVTRSSWLMYPAQAGPMSLHLPDIWVETKAGRKIRLPQETRHIDVRPLPPGTPPGVFVGTPRWQQTEAPPTHGRVGQRIQWQTTLVAPGATLSLPSALPQWTVADGDARIHVEITHYRQSETADGIEHHITYSWSVLPQRGGVLTLPPLRFPYFDTQRGRLDTIALPDIRFDIAAADETAAPGGDAPVMMLESSAAAPSAPANTLLLLWALFASVLALTASIGWFRALAQSRRTVAAPDNAPPSGQTSPPKANSHPALHALLSAFGEASLAQGWARHQALYGNDPEIANAVLNVQQALYGTAATAPPEKLLAQAQRAADRVRQQQQARPSAPDPWLPESFSVRIEQGAATPTGNTAQNRPTR